MPIASTDILAKLSAPAATAGNQTAQADPNQSLGKYISTTQLSTTPANNLFADLTGDQNAAQVVQYRCIFLHNNHATLTWQNSVVWIPTQTAGGADAAIGIDTTAASAVGSATAQALSITNDTTAPVGIAFSAPATKATGLALGNLGPGQCRAVWVRRTATNSAPLSGDGVTIQWEGDTAA